MHYQTLTEISVKTAQGKALLNPGTIINLDPAKAKSLIVSGKIKPIEATPMSIGRLQSLEASIDAIIAETMDVIAKACNGKQFRSNDDIRKAEVEEAAIYKKVMNGNAKLDEFKTAANKWKELSLIENPIKRN